MTNDMDFIPIRMDGHMFVPGHTLLALGLMLVAAVVIGIGAYRLARYRKTAQELLPTTRMLVTAVAVLGLGTCEALFAVADWLRVEAACSSKAPPQQLICCFTLAVADQLTILCIPVALATAAFCLAIAMKRKTE